MKNHPIIVLASILLLIFSIHTSVSACLCENLPVKKRVKRMKRLADAVFTGEAREITGEGDRNGGPSRVVLTVSKSWKAWSPKEYTIYTGGGCAAYFEVGRQYLVYAQKDSSGKLTTDICMGTGLLRLATKDLKYLGRPVEVNKTESIKPAFLVPPLAFIEPDLEKNSFENLLQRPCETDKRSND